jgi:hypothetical protein
LAAAGVLAAGAITIARIATRPSRS